MSLHSATTAAIATIITLQSVNTSSRASLHPRCRDSKRRICVAANCSTAKYSRRLLLMTGFVPIFFKMNPVLTAPIPEMEESVDIFAGEGQSANEGDVVVFNYVCRRSNGYFVYSTVDQFTGEAMPVTLPLDENQIIKGLKDVIVGMKVGGKY